MNRDYWAGAALAWADWRGQGNQGSIYDMLYVHPGVEIHKLRDRVTGEWMTLDPPHVLAGPTQRDAIADLRRLEMAGA